VGFVTGQLQLSVRSRGKKGISPPNCTQTPFQQNDSPSNAIQLADPSNGYYNECIDHPGFNTPILRRWIAVSNAQTVLLNDQIAVVTGSSSGIGRAIALQLAGAGADVLVHARTNASGAQTVVDEIRGLGRKSTLHLADLADDSARQTLVDSCWAWQGQVNIWVNNAGADVLTGDASDWTFDRKLDTLWHVDVLATIQLSRSVGQRMSEPGGVILNMGWDQAESGMAGESGEMFAATKGAIMSFSRSLAQSLAPKVRVNCLAPGWIKTAWGQQASDYWQQRAEHEALLGRWGTPDDVARAAAFLVSPAADFITGQVLKINGGRIGGNV
jgi:3-oxoacyl-[acyl-carrier protein] reductase